MAGGLVDPSVRPSGGVGDPARPSPHRRVCRCVVVATDRHVHRCGTICTICLLMWPLCPLAGRARAFLALWGALQRRRRGPGWGGRGVRLARISVADRQVSPSSALPGRGPPRGPPPPWRSLAPSLTPQPAVVPRFLPGRCAFRARALTVAISAPTTRGVRPALLRSSDNPGGLTCRLPQRPSASGVRGLRRLALGNSVGSPSTTDRRRGFVWSDVGRCVSQSVARSVGQSVSRSVGRWVCLSVGRSVGPSVGQSVGRSVGPSAGRSVGRAARRSVGQSRV